MAYSRQSNHGIGIGFAGGRKYGPYGDVISGGLIGELDLLGIVGGHTEPEVGADDFSRALGTKIVLADVDSVEFGGEAEVGAVVHDQCGFRADLRFEFAGMSKHSPRVIGFVAILDQGDSAIDQRMSSAKKLLRRGKARSVKNGVELGKNFASSHDRF